MDTNSLNLSKAYFIRYILVDHAHRRSMWYNEMSVIIIANMKSKPNVASPTAS